MELRTANASSRDRSALPESPPTDARPLPRGPDPAGPADWQRLAERLDRAENPVGVRAELRTRLNSLVVGHPSSPWDEHGVPRPPGACLSEAERLEPPLSDAAYAAHVADVSRSLDAARARRVRRSWQDNTA